MAQSITQFPKVEDGDTPNQRARRPGVLKRTQALFMAALVLLDIGSIWAAYYIAHTILTRDPSIQIGPFLEFQRLPILNTLVLVGTFFMQRMYQRRRPISHLDEFLKIILYNSFAVLITIALLTLLRRDIDYHRSLVVYAWLLSIGILTFLRTVHAQLQWQIQARGIGDDRVLIIGAGEIGQMLIQKILTNPQLGYQVIGVVDNGKSDRATYPKNVTNLGTLADIPWIIDRYGIDEVIVGLPESNHQELVNIISLCEREKVGIRVFPDVFQMLASEVNIGDLGGLPLLTIRDVALQGWMLALKRSMDVMVSVVALILSSPLMLFTAILIKLESPGPVFYTQERMGLDARPFKIIKFRSMRHDAESSGPGWTRPDDPRKTKLGNFIRSTNLDEFPQFVNVLIGDMSLVGPRPERPVYVEQFRQSIPRYMDRHREKAGLTGWAQVNGLRGDTSIAERTKYDLWYIENWSLWLDIKIILRTLVQMVLRVDKNAY